MVYCINTVIQITDGDKDNDLTAHETYQLQIVQPVMVQYWTDNLNEIMFNITISPEVTNENTSDDELIVEKDLTKESNFKYVSVNSGYSEPSLPLPTIIVIITSIYFLFVLAFISCKYYIMQQYNYN